MANVTTQSVVRQIESLYGGGSVAGLSDRQLVERFVTRRDVAGEDAFAALVARHGPMVLGVCRQLLVDRQHAEDAFQAVFLVLARRARSVRDPDLLCNWLYGIALRTARKARARLARQRRNEEDRAVTTLQQDTASRGRSDRDRSRAGRDASRRDRPSAGIVPPAGRALLLRGAHARSGRHAPPLPGRNHPQSIGPAREQAPPRARLAAVWSCLPPPLAALLGVAVGLGVSLILPVRNHHARRDPLRGRTGRRSRGDGPCPGGAEIHALDQVRVHRAGPAHSRPVAAGVGYVRPDGCGAETHEKPGRASIAADKAKCNDKDQPARRRPRRVRRGADDRGRPRARPGGQARHSGTGRPGRAAAHPIGGYRRAEGRVRLARPGRRRTATAVSASRRPVPPRQRAFSNVYALAGTPGPGSGLGWATLNPDAAAARG